jgi:hypothetical protein
MQKTIAQAVVVQDMEAQVVQVVLTLQVVQVVQVA